MSDIILLDGAIGQELVTRHPKPATRLWGVQVMLDSPETLRDIHLDYFKAGASVATLNTYNILPDRLEPVGLEDQFEALHLKACQLACEARDQHGSGQVALSLGPLGASYRPDLSPSPEEAAEIYARVVRLHADADVILLETVSSIDSARGALMGAAISNKPIWLALSVEDNDGTVLRSGEAVKDVMSALSDLRYDAVLFNCSTPEAINTAFGQIDKTALPFGAYANGFTGIAQDFRKPGAVVDVLKARTDLGPVEYANTALNWVEDGAQIVGGCCEVRPDHISEIANQLRSRHHRIVTPS